MKVVIMGGTGLIGSRLAKRLEALGAQVAIGSPTTGVDAVSGKGLQGLLDRADVVVDVMNTRDYEPEAALSFFNTATRNVVGAAMGAGVRHYVALSLVGADRLPLSGYFRAKHAQEDLIRSASIPWTILRSTQFFEFAPRLVETAAEGDHIRIAPARVRPIAADDVVDFLAAAAMGEARRVIEITGPTDLRLDNFLRDYLEAVSDTRPVWPDPRAYYFGSWINDEALVPEAPVSAGDTTFGDWLRIQVTQS